MREKYVEDYLRTRVRAAGGQIRKVRWIGRAGAPDERVMLPKRGNRPARAFWVECKAPDANWNTPHVQAQIREHRRMRDCGEEVHIVSDLAEVDALFE